MLTVVTPTGERPDAFALCERMMARQTYAGPVRWIVVDDGARETVMGSLAANWTRIVLRPDPPWRPGENTQGRNLTAALDAAALLRQPDEALRIAIVEDDDWYDPRWLETLDARLDGADMAGESHARYYNVRGRIAADLGNEFHASLRASAVAGAGIEALRRVIALRAPYFDWAMWRDPAPVKTLFKTRLTVGLKGLPGRAGLAAGHQRMRGARDRDLAILREWIGADADWYAPFYEEDAMTETTVPMIARKLRRYGTRRLVAGETFDALPKDVRKLERLRLASPAPAEHKTEDTEAPPAPEAEAKKTRGKKRDAAAFEDAPVAADRADDAAHNAKGE